MNKKITVVVLFSILAIVIYLSFKLKNDETDRIKENHHETIGVITNVGWKTVDISYTVNGETYIYTQNKPYKGLIVGEEFYTMADKNDLNRAIVYFVQPIMDTLKFKFTIVNPTDVHTIVIDNDELSFSYKVGTNEIERIQKYKDGERPEDLKNLKVKYRVDKPEIGYLIKE